MVRRILVPMDPSPFAKAALKNAFRIAAQHGAEVTALAVLDKPGIEHAVGPGTPASMPFVEKAEHLKISSAHEHIQTMLAEADKAGDELNVAHRVIEIEGDPIDTIAHEAMFYDLLVMGLKTYFRHETSSKADASLKKMLGRLATPILVVGEDGLRFNQPRVLVAYHDSLSSARSLRQFVTLSPFTDARVTLLTSTDKQEEGQEVLAKASELLLAAGYRDVRLEWTPRAIIDALKEEYLSEADLVVAGTHTKRSWFDFSALGSVADYLLDEGGVPLFIGQ